MKITDEKLWAIAQTNPHWIGIEGYSIDYSSTRFDNRLIHLIGGYNVPLQVLTVLTNNLFNVVSEEPEGYVTVTTNEAGECVLVSRQDEDHKILKVIWEKK